VPLDPCLFFRNSLVSFSPHPPSSFVARLSGRSGWCTFCRTEGSTARSVVPNFVKHVLTAETWTPLLHYNNGSHMHTKLLHWVLPVLSIRMYSPWGFGCTKPLVTVRYAGNSFQDKGEGSGSSIVGQHAAVAHALCCRTSAASLPPIQSPIKPPVYGSSMLVKPVCHSSLIYERSTTTKRTSLRHLVGILRCARKAKRSDAPHCHVRNTRTTSYEYLTHWHFPEHGDMAPNGHNAFYVHPPLSSDPSTTLWTG